MKRTAAYFFLLSLFVLVIVSCHKDNPIQPSSSFQTDYYPLRVGQYAIFDVDSIRFFDVTLTSDTAHYQIKELLDSMFTDNTGKPAFRVNRMKRKNDSATWETTDIWTTNLTPTTAEKVEENQRFIKLLFPVADGKSWNGNAYINTTGNLAYLANWNYTYSDVNVSKHINIATFDSTVTVTAEDEQNLIQKDFEQEIYGARKGLLYKISEHVSKQNVANGWDKPEKGYIIKMSIREFHP